MPSDHLTPCAMLSVSVLLPLLHFQLVREPRQRRLPALGRDDQRLVDRALDELTAREAGRGEGVEVLGERRVAGARHDEALVSSRRSWQRLRARSGRCGRDGDERTSAASSAAPSAPARPSRGRSGSDVTSAFLSRPARGDVSRCGSEHFRKFPVTVTTFASRCQLSSDNRCIDPSWSRVSLRNNCRNRFQVLE